jgi:hypothetical protein
MNRTCEVDLLSGTFPMISLQDLRQDARLALDLAEDRPTPAKHARDFLHLTQLVDPGEAESVWSDHRKAQHPPSFTNAAVLLQTLIPIHAELLITPRYSQDINQVCLHCVPAARFRLGDPRVVMDSLGYC